MTRRPPSLLRRGLALAAAGAVSAAGLGLTAGPAAATTGPYRLSTTYSPALGTTEVARWDPCSLIPYRINAALGGRRAIEDTKEAVARLSAASGLHFQYLGLTSYVPSAGRASLPGAPLVVAWALPGTGPSRTNVLGPGEVGRGGWAAAAAPSGHVRIGRGYVLLRAGSPLAMGFGPGITRGRMLMHELGHAVGLRHVDDGSQVMYPTVSPASSSAVYRAGDLAGLRRVGAPAGCIS